MPTVPTESLATLRPDLRDTLMEFDLAADQAGFVGHRIAPVREVDRAFGQFPKVVLKELLKQQDTRRTPDGGYNRGQGKGTKETYVTDEHGLEERVDDNEATMYGEWWEAEVLATMRCLDAVLRNHNKRIIDLSLTNSNTAAVSSGAWSTTASSKPIADVRTAKINIRNRTGIVPDAMCLDYEVFEYLKDNAEIIDRLKYSGLQDPNRENITAQALATAFDLSEVIISGSVQNSANDAQAASLSSMWDKTKALIFKKQMDSTGRILGYMRTFHWGADGSQIGGVIETYRDESRRGDIVRVRMQTDEKILYEDLAEVITGVAA